jgi:hypothetical protein
LGLRYLKAQTMLCFEPRVPWPREPN